MAHGVSLKRSLLVLLTILGLGEVRGGRRGGGVDGGGPWIYVVFFVGFVLLSCCVCACIAFEKLCRDEKPRNNENVENAEELLPPSYQASVQ